MIIAASLRFGTDEFVEYCRAIGIEPCVCSVHIHTGSDDHYLNIALVHHAGRCIRSCWTLTQEVRYTLRM